MGVTRTIEQIARGIEILGITTLVSGLAIAVVRAVNILIHSRSAESAYRTVRTFLSFSLEVEIDGVWPWRRAALAQGPSSPSHRPNGPEQQ